jgi:hypothetical protein
VGRSEQGGKCGGSERRDQFSVHEILLRLLAPSGQLGCHDAQSARAVSKRARRSPACWNTTVLRIIAAAMAIKRQPSAGNRRGTRE